MPGGGGRQSQVTIPFFRRELAVRAFWSNAILCRLDFKGLCSGGGGSDKVQQVEVSPEDALAAEEQSNTFQ